MELIKIGKNEYRPDGQKEYLKWHMKTVTVDGEEYKKEWNTVEIFDCAESFETKNGWHCIEVDDFVEFGLPLVKVWDYHNFSWNSPVQMCINTKYSENTYVNLLMYLWEDTKIFRTRKMHIWRGKEERGYEKTENILRYDRVVMPVLRYGFNNAVDICIDIKKFLELDFSKLDIFSKHHVEQYYEKPQYLLGQRWSKVSFLPMKVTDKAKLTDEEKYKIMKHILELKIRYKRMYNN